MGFKGWLIRGIICSLLAAVAVYLLELMELFDLKTTIIAILVIGFLLSTLIGWVFKKKPSNSPNKFVVKGFAGR